jgi:hypothetical protein
MLPMGIKQAPDIAQETMESIFIDLPNVEVYIDDIKGTQISLDWSQTALP